MLEEGEPMSINCARANHVVTTQELVECSLRRVITNFVLCRLSNVNYGTPSTFQDLVSSRQSIISIKPLR